MSLSDQSEEILRQVIRNIPDAVAVTDGSGVFTLFNEAASRLLGLVEDTAPAEGDISVPFRIYLPDAVTPCPPDDLPLVRALHGQSTSNRLLFVRSLPNPDGRWILASAIPIGQSPGAILVCRDITESRRADLQRTRVLKSLTFLNQATSILSDSLDHRKTLTELALAAVRDVAHFCSCGLIEAVNMEILVRTAREEGVLASPVVRYPLAALPPDHPIAQILAGRPSLSFRDLDDAWIRSVSVTPEQESLLRRLNLDSYVLAPIVAHSQIFGVLALGFSGSDQASLSDEADFTAELGHRVGVAIDNALLHQAVKQSEAQYRALSEALPQLLWTCRPDGYCDYLSPQWAEYTGVPVEQQLGWNWPDALHPEDRERAGRSWQHAATTASEYDIEYRMRRRDGAYRWFKAKGLPIRDAQGVVLRWFGSSTDIDDQKRAQLAEHEARLRLTAALDASGTGTFRWDILTNELDWDENLDRLFGLPPGETARALEQFLAMVHPDDRQRVVDSCARCAAEGADFSLEFRVIWPDGSIHWLFDRGKTFRDEHGRPVSMTGACVDITSRVLAETQAADRARYVRNVLEAIPQMVWTTDRQGVVEYVNQQWIEFTGLDVPGILNNGWRDVFHPDDVQQTSTSWIHALEAGTAYEAEHRMRSPGGQYRWFLSRGVPLRDSSGQIVSWFGTSTDITLQKTVEQERLMLLSREQAARAEAESAAEALAAANLELEHFVYAASHDLKAPLRGICSYSQLLQRRLRGQADPTTNEFLDFIASSASRLSHLVDELLAYSKVSNSPVPQNEEVDMESVRDSVLRALHTVLDENSATVESAPLPKVHGSASQLAEVLQNLISNAVKYRRPEAAPHIRISVEKVATHYIFHVADNGCGFSPEYADTIFGLFKRLHGGEIEGSGLGLALCRRVIERHGGKIWATSTLGEGSTFSFTIPL